MLQLKDKPWTVSSASGHQTRQEYRHKQYKVSLVVNPNALIDPWINLKTRKQPLRGETYTATGAELPYPLLLPINNSLDSGGHIS
jgi:hypothetical protein